MADVMPARLRELADIWTGPGGELRACADAWEAERKALVSSAMGPCEVHAEITQGCVRCMYTRCERAERDLADTRSYVAEVAQGITHYLHDDDGSCVRCELDAAQARVAELEAKLAEAEGLNRGEVRARRGLQVALAAERALADRLAEALEHETDGKPTYSGTADALAAWREARREP